MSVFGRLVATLNREVISKADALEVIDAVRSDIESGDDSVTVGEVLAIFIKSCGASMSWVSAAFSLFGILIGLVAGYLAL